LTVIYPLLFLILGIPFFSLSLLPSVIC
jgi:hypothetical protein